MELGWRVVEQVELIPTRHRRGILIFTKKKRGQSNAQYHVLTLASGRFEPLVVGLDKGDNGEGLHTIHCPPPPSRCRPSSWSSGHLFGRV